MSDASSPPTPQPDAREVLVRAIKSAREATGRVCSIDTCVHYAGYLDSGDMELCACHWSDAVADECDGQPEPIAPSAERIADAVLAAGFTLPREAPVPDVDVVERVARAEAERRIDECGGLHYDMEADAFVAGATWAALTVLEGGQK